MTQMLRGNERKIQKTMFIATMISVFLLAGLYMHPAVGAPNCLYKFSVPASDCAVAPEIDDQLKLLESIVQNQQSQLQLLTDRINAIENPKPCIANPGSGIDPGVGTTYVRWGRTVCPDTAQLVYEGYAGKASAHQNGGGVDYQCLPKDPDWPAGATGGHQSKSYMYGVEYQHLNSPVWPPSIDEHDMPCAVCSVNGRGRKLMIPAKLGCPVNWVMEYSGILGASYHDHSGSTFICVDSQMETVEGGHENKNGGLVYVVEAVCGSLPCPDYIDGNELSCVVCTY